MSESFLYRRTWGGSVSPDGSAFAHIVDVGGYPRAAQRFLHFTETSSARWVELPVDGPVEKILHSADGHWLACEVSPGGGEHHQVWVVTTDPEDRAARRLGEGDSAGTMELVCWDGNRVGVSATGADGVSEAQLIDPQTQETTVLDRRMGARLVDSWNGAALLRVGPRGYRELLLIRDGRMQPLLPADPGSTTDAGVLLDFEHGWRTSLFGAQGADDGVVQMLVRSDFECENHRLLAVEVADDGVRYRVLAERESATLDEFAVSNDMSTVALVWNREGYSETQILNLTDGSVNPPVRLPGLVARELSMSTAGSVLTVTVEGPGLPPQVQLVDVRRAEVIPLEPTPTVGRDAPAPSLERFIARDGLELSGLLYRSPHVPGGEPGPTVVYFHGGPEAQSVPGYNSMFEKLLAAGFHVFAPNVRGSGGLGRTFSHADDRYGRFAAIADAADCADYLVDAEIADADRIACSGRSYGGYLTLASLTFHPDRYAAGVAICGMSDLESFYRNTEPWIAAAAYTKYGHPEHDRELLRELSPIHHIDRLVAPLLVVHGVHDTNVPVTESLQIVDAVTAQGGSAKAVLFEDEGHAIVKRGNKDRLAREMIAWLEVSFAG
ncbi:S9 family peptidase [Tsukamurella soli]|uniref:Alpha/beta fold hydrolase n=1 Tax=Tsukamurella soli TaxID=644556 RepID=A0ABP8JS06_9ACTN